jgi:uracil-DNA glycosylase family 4
MLKDVNKAKVVRQHKELDDFFTGGVSVRSGKRRPAAEPVSATPEQPIHNEVAAELEKIAAESARCCKCGLGKTRKHNVPGEGNPHPRLVFVGEAPGADEDEAGRPFVGRAGQLLDKIIAAMGLRRQDVFICNVLKCRPPNNRDPLPDEIIACIPFLERQLEAIKPEIIVALGAHAARTLLKTEEAIGRLRGQFHDYYTASGYGPIKLMPTYHPAYLLRNYSDDNRRRVWEDMQKVMKELGLEKK